VSTRAEKIADAKSTSKSDKKPDSDKKADKTASKSEAPSLSKESADTKADATPISPEEAADLDLKNRIAFSQDKFDQFDTNHDGFVDASEAAVSTVLRASFARFDADKDGKLSPAEFAAINDLAAIKQTPREVRRLQ